MQPDRHPESSGESPRSDLLSAPLRSDPSPSAQDGEKRDSTHSLEGRYVKSAPPQIVEGPQGLELVAEGMTVRGDLTRLLPRLKPGRLQRELLVRAARIKDPRSPERPTAVDATAGLGEDSLLLAAAGFDVLLFERNETIAALLMDSLQRAADTPELAGIVGRMHTVQVDSTQALGNLDFLPDVILLDPMFPAKHKDAAAKKKLQLLQQLEQPCEDEAALLDAALSARPLKIVIKRPVKGPFLAGRKPDYSLSGKAIRYDCFALPR